LLSCGQLLTNTSRSRSARSSTYLPGAETPSWNDSDPSAPTGTFMKKLMLCDRSATVRPWASAVATKLTRQACWCRVWAPYRTTLLACEHAPPRVSWRPQVSSTIVASRSSRCVSSRDPVVR